MQKIWLPLIILFVIVAASSCKDEDTDMAHMTQLQDSINTHYPTAQGIHINPEDRENLIVVLGDLTLYPASADVKQREATDIGKMAVSIFGKDSYLRKGKLVVTKDIHNTSNEPADGITVNINIDSLKKALFP
jgi:hypothetical protein